VTNEMVEDLYVEANQYALVSKKILICVLGPDNVKVVLLCM